MLMNSSIWQSKLQKNTGRRMGLDEFLDDDSSNSSSSSSTTNTKQVDRSDFGASKFNIIQAFDKTGKVTPQQIKYQVRSIDAGWKSQFSLERMEKGELVLYSSGFHASSGGEVVMIFTTIQSVTEDEYNGDSKDIWVVFWDLDEGENIDEGAYINRDEGWEEVLFNEVDKRIKSLSN